MLRTLTGLLLAMALLAACADAGAGDGEAAGGGSDPTTTSTPGTAPPPPTTKSPTPTPTTAPGSPGKSQITATGTLRDGVEPGCLLLQSEQGTLYLLVGGDRGKLTAGGARVQVTGVLSPDLLSICQEGQPLVVRSIKPAP